MPKPSFLVRNESSYLAPEQWQNLPGSASDQYALAIRAYELLTNRRPFTGDHLQELMYQQMNVSPKPPSEINTQIPTAVDRVILCALSADSQRRYDCITRFAQAFQRAVQYKDLSSTIDLSLSEAKNGSNKIVTFPELNIEPPPEVVLPPNIQDGDSLYLYYDENGIYGDDTGDSPKGKLTINIRIRRDTSVLTPRPTRVLPPLDSTVSVPYHNPILANSTTTPVLTKFTSSPNLPQRSSQRWVITASVLACILLIATGVIIILIVSLNSAELSASDNRATAVAQFAATVTAQANLNATVTAQANLNATATAIAEVTPTTPSDTSNQDNSWVGWAVGFAVFILIGIGISIGEADNKKN